jgi:multiple sugar transport system permease protein
MLMMVNQVRSASGRDWRRRLRRPSVRRALTGYLLVSPALALFLAFHIFPTIYVLYLSTRNWNFIRPEHTSVGLANFQTVLTNQQFHQALLNTAYFVLNVPVGMVLALLVAVALQNIRRLRLVLRAMYFMPAITASVPIAMVFMWLYDADFGLINYALRLIGITGPRWLGSTTWAMPSLIILGVWHSLGYKMVLYLAGLTSIPTEYYEAAMIDGASAWQKLRHITIPLITPVTLFILVTSTISSFQVFSQIYIMTQGGPLGSTNTVAYIIFQYAFQYFRMGIASSMSVVLLALLAILAFIQLRIGGSKTTYLG